MSIPMRTMSSSERKSLISDSKDNHVSSQPKIYQADTSKPTTLPQNRLLHWLLEENFQNFNDLVQHEVVDIDYFYGAPYNGTLLDIACRSRGMSEFVKIILQKNVNMNAINKVTGKAAIHEAIESSAVDVIEVLIGYRCLINIEDRNGNTPLHTAIKKNDLHIIDFLLRSKGGTIDINMSNRQNPTPLHVALLNGYIKAAISLLQYPYIDLDFQTDSEGRTCRQIIQQKYPKLYEKQFRNPKRYSGNPANILFSLLERGETEKFIELALKMSTEFLNNRQDFRNGGTFLEHSCYHGYADVVDILLRKGVDPNKTTVGASFTKNASISNVKGTAPIQIAAENGYYDVFSKLLSHPEIELHTKEAGSPLHSVINGMFHPFYLKSREGRQHRKCLELMLNEVIPQGRLNIDYADEEGNTALHDAVLFNDEYVIKSLIYAGAHLYSKNFKGEIPLTSIKSNILEDYLDDCISSRNDSVYARNFEITFDYSVFVKPSRLQEPEGHGTKFFTIIERFPELRKLLKHPVSQSFLYIKWCFVRKYFYMNLILYIMFCSMLSLYIIQIHQSIWSLNEDFILQYGRIVIMVFCGMLFLRELTQFCVSPGLYIKSTENWIEILVILTTVSLLVLVDKTNADEQSSISALTIIISWIELVVMLGKHPACSNYIKIFKTVTCNFCKYLFMYSILIVSFAFSFYILFKQSTQIISETLQRGNNLKNEIFNGPWGDPVITFMRSVIMLTGEFGIEDIPLGPKFTSKHLFLILFAFLNIFVLYIVLIGIANSDIRAIRKDSEMLALMSQVELISQLELFAMFSPCRHLYHLVPSRFSYPRAWLLIIGERIASFYDTIFLENITMYPTTKIDVLPYRENEIRFHYKLSARKKKHSLKMPLNIVKRTKQILENRNEFDAMDHTADSLQVRTIKKYPPKFQSIDNLDQKFIALDEKISRMDEKISKMDEKIAKRLINDMRNLWNR